MCVLYVRRSYVCPLVFLSFFNLFFSLPDNREKSTDQGAIQRNFFRIKEGSLLSTAPAYI